MNNEPLSGDSEAVIFSINTTRDYFIDWLAEKILLKTNPAIKSLLEKQPNKRFSDFPKQAGMHPEEKQLIVINTTNDSKNTKNMVCLNVTTIGKNRIEVEASYEGNVFLAFSEILIMIVKTFNESGEPIVHYLEGKLLPENPVSNSINANNEVFLNSGNINGSVVINGNNNYVEITNPSGN